LTLARALWLCAALLAAQWLGHAHAVAHGAGAGAAPTAASHAQADCTPAALGFAPAFQVAQHDHDHAPDLSLADGHEAGGAECRLIDQLGHAALLWAAQAPAGQLEQRDPAPQAGATAPPAAAPAAGYQARAPPPHR
jgi:hypothetical protein